MTPQTESTLDLVIRKSKSRNQKPEDYRVSAYVGPLRLIGYRRTSTDEQKKSGTSMITQRDRIRKYCEDNGYILVAELEEDYTGTVYSRPELNKALQMLANDEADGIVCMTVDRLARKTLIFSVLWDQLTTMKKELHFWDFGKASQDKFDDLLILVLRATLSEGEVRKILSRMSDGKRERLVTEGIPLMARPAYGYFKPSKNVIEINVEEAEVVRQMFYWMAYGQIAGDPVSTTAIARELNRQGIPLSTANRKNKESGSKWAQSVVHRMLTNPIYAGVYYYGRTKRLGNDTNARDYTDPSEWVKVPVPHLAIIDEETFNMVQKRLKDNTAKAKRNRKHQYLLSGHFRCGHCGRAMTGGPASKPHLRKYQCASRNYAAYDVVKCSHCYNSIGAEKAERLVWEWLKWLLSDPHHLKYGLQQKQERIAQELAPKLSQLKALETTIARIETQVVNLVTEMSNIENSQARAIVVNQINSLGEQKTEALKDRANLERELATNTIDDTKIEKAYEIAEQVSGKLENPSYENVRFLLDLFDIKVTIVFTDTKKYPNWDKSPLKRYLKIDCFLDLAEKWVSVDDDEDADVDEKNNNGPKSGGNGGIHVEKMGKKVSFQHVHRDGRDNTTTLCIQGSIAVDDDIELQALFRGSITSVFLQDKYADVR